MRTEVVTIEATFRSAFQQGNLSIVIESSTNNSVFQQGKQLVAIESCAKWDEIRYSKISDADFDEYIKFQALDVLKRLDQYLSDISVEYMIDDEKINCLKSKN